MKNINVRINCGRECEIIETNLYNLSRSLGRKINLSELIRHVLISTTSKKSLYDLGFISLVELHNQEKIMKGKKEVNLKRRKTKF